MFILTFKDLNKINLQEDVHEKLVMLFALLMVMSLSPISILAYTPSVAGVPEVNIAKYFALEYGIVEISTLEINESISIPIYLNDPTARGSGLVGHFSITRLSAHAFILSMQNASSFALFLSANYVVSQNIFPANGIGPPQFVVSGPRIRELPTVFPPVIGFLGPTATTIFHYNNWDQTHMQLIGVNSIGRPVTSSILIAW